MARRKSKVEEFFGGFSDGWDLAGQVGAAYDMAQMDEGEVTQSFDKDNYAGNLGLDKGSQQALELARQDAEFGNDAANSTAESLNYAAGSPRAKTGLSDKDLGTSYNYRGRSYSAAPTDYEKSYADEMENARIYKKWGMLDEAKDAKKLAMDYSQQGLINDLRKEQVLSNRQQREFLDKFNPGRLREQQQTLDFNEAYNPLRLSDAALGLAQKGQDLEYNAQANPIRLADAAMGLAQKGQAFDHSAIMNPLTQAGAQLDVAAKGQNLAYDAQANPLKLEGLELTNRLNKLTADDKSLDAKQKKQVVEINNRFGKALDGDMGAVTGNDTLMESLAGFYNNTEFADDDRSMTRDPKTGQWMVTMGPGEADPQVPAETVIQELYQQQPEAFRKTIARAHQYAVAGVTGNYDSLYKNDAYAAKAEKDRRGTAKKAPEILQAKAAKGQLTLPELMKYTGIKDVEEAKILYRDMTSGSLASLVRGKDGKPVKPPLTGGKAKPAEASSVPEGGLRTPDANAQYQQQLKADSLRGKDVTLYLDAIERAPDYATAYEMLNEPGIAEQLDEYGLLEAAKRAVQDRADDGTFTNAVRGVTRQLGLRNKYLR